MTRGVGLTLGVGTVLLGCYAIMQGPAEVPEATPSAPVLSMEGVQLTSYACGEQGWTLRAAHGHEGRTRLGFLQTPFIPTVELDDVTIEQRHHDGSVTTQHLPRAVINWMTKVVSTPSGAPVLRMVEPSTALPADHDATPRSFCLS